MGRPGRRVWNRPVRNDQGSAYFANSRIGCTGASRTVLEARVDLPDGWVHLSTTSPSLATRPVFVNKTTQSIVALRSAYDILQDPNDRETNRFTFDGGTIDWFTAPGADRSISTTAFGINLPPNWLGYRDQRAGLLETKNATVVLMVFPPTDGSEKSILEFCRAVEAIPSD